MAEEVAEPAAEQEETPEGEQVGVHDPGERGLREAEILPDRRQRDVHDRRIENDHQAGEAEHVQREPACAAVQGHGVSPLRLSFCRVRPLGDAELIGARTPMNFARPASLSRDGLPFAADDRVRRRGAPRPQRPAWTMRACLRVARDEARRRRAMRCESSRAECGDGRCPRAAPARRPTPRLPGSAAQCVRRVARAARLPGVERCTAGRRYESSRAGRPKSGNSVSVARKNVNSTIRASSISSTCNAHGS